MHRPWYRSVRSKTLNLEIVDYSGVRKFIQFGPSRLRILDYVRRYYPELYFDESYVSRHLEEYIYDADSAKGYIKRKLTAMVNDRLVESAFKHAGADRVDRAVIVEHFLGRIRGVTLSRSYLVYVIGGKPFVMSSLYRRNDNIPFWLEAGFIVESIPRLARGVCRYAGLHWASECARRAYINPVIARNWLLLYLVFYRELARYMHPSGPSEWVVFEVPRDINTSGE